MCIACEHDQPICGADPKGARPPCILPEGHAPNEHENVHGERFGNDEVVHPETNAEYAERTADRSAATGETTPRTLDVTPNFGVVIRYAKQGLQESAPDSEAAEAFRNVLRECGVDPEGW